jgi:hypothetical protein
MCRRILISPWSQTLRYWITSEDIFKKVKQLINLFAILLNNLKFKIKKEATDNLKALEVVLLLMVYLFCDRISL